MRKKHPKTIAAVQNSELSQWTIGDALLQECGPPSTAGQNDGSRAELAEVAEEIEELGIEGYSPITLARYREIAYKFPRRARLARLSWGCHCDAGSPEMLEAIIKSAGNRPVTGDYVRAMRNAIQEQQAEDYKKVNPGSGPPKKADLADMGIPSQSKMKGLTLKALIMGWAAELANADDIVLQATAKVEKYLSKLEEPDVDYLVEKALVLAKHARELADVTRKLQANKRTHISLVEKEAAQ